jgi:hypothetical protein
MSEGRGPGKAPTADQLKVKNTTVLRDDVIITKYGSGYRWWPSPESRKGGSQRWVVPAVEHWHPAASVAAILATRVAREST